MASRRAADELIASGVVRVNGKRPPPTGLLIDPNVDRVTVDGKAVTPVTRHRYIVLNKPLDVITTARDESARTNVLDVVGDEGKAGHRLFPVGRLDADTTGLLLLTDDGDLAFALTHPRYKVAKEYIAHVTGNPSTSDVESLRKGVELDDGMTAPAEVEVLRITPGSRDSGIAEVRIVIREGRHRQVRRMLHAIGHKVQSLRRVGFGPLKLGRLKVGGWRVLGEAEIAALQRAISATSSPPPRRGSLRDPGRTSPPGGEASSPPPRRGSLRDPGRTSPRGGEASSPPPRRESLRDPGRTSPQGGEASSPPPRRESLRDPGRTSPQGGEAR